MKKQFILTLFTVLVGTAVNAQQIGLNSQYLFNETVINPGATGTKNYVPVQINFRKQWVRFPDSPTSQFVTAHGNVGKNFGIGGVIYNEVAGPSRHTGITINGCYQLRLSKDNNHHLGMGLGVSFTQHMIDPTKLTTYLPDDPSVVRGYNNVMVPDANVGFYYYFKDKAFFGISGKNLVQMERDLYQFENPFVNVNVRNYYAIGGYRFDLPKKFALKVTGLLQFIESGVWQAEGSLIASYNNRFWLGGSYRYDDAVVFMGGLQFGVFKFGYSYDYTLSDIAKYSVGSHQLFLELQIFNNKQGAATGDGRTPWLKRNRIYSPGI